MTGESACPWKHKARHERVFLRLLILLSNQLPPVGFALYSCNSHTRLKPNASAGGDRQFIHWIALLYPLRPRRHVAGQA